MSNKHLVFNKVEISGYLCARRAVRSHEYMATNVEQLLIKISYLKYPWLTLTHDIALPTTGWATWHLTLKFYFGKQKCKSKALTWQKWGNSWCLTPPPQSHNNWMKVLHLKPLHENCQICVINLFICIAAKSLCLEETISKRYYIYCLISS